MRICPQHCPQPDSAAGVVVAVAVVAVAAGVAVAVDWVWSELPLLAVAAVAFVVPMLAWCAWMVVHYRGQPPWEKPVKQRKALPARVPLAIEAPKADLTAVVLESRTERVSR